jgi:hypothetical protein
MYLAQKPGLIPQALRLLSEYSLLPWCEYQGRWLHLLRMRQLSLRLGGQLSPQKQVLLEQSWSPSLGLEVAKSQVEFLQNSALVCSCRAFYSRISPPFFSWERRGLSALSVQSLVLWLLLQLSSMHACMGLACIERDHFWLGIFMALGVFMY